MITKEESLQLKGVAVLLLLFHHFFYYSENALLQSLIGISKSCVAIFVFLSGYGLVATTKDNINILVFLKTRITKLMIPYWVIFVLFVNVGLIFNLRTLDQAYGENGIVKLILEFFALHMFAFGNGYNATWWFMSLILLLYVLFIPLLKLIKKYDIWFLYMFLTLSLLVLPRTMMYLKMEKMLELTGASSYILCFIVGMYMSLSKQVFAVKGIVKYLVVLLGFLTIIFYRNKFVCILPGVPLDVSIVLLGIMVYKSKKFLLLSKFLGYWGEYSYEIFLTHTFLLTYFIHGGVIYKFDSIILNFIEFVILSLLLGIISNYIVKAVNLSTANILKMWSKNANSI